MIHNIRLLNEMREYRALLMEKINRDIDGYHDSMKRILAFASGKRKPKFGKYANQFVDYQPDDYLRMGKTLSFLKSKILTLQSELESIKQLIVEQKNEQT